MRIDEVAAGRPYDGVIQGRSELIELLLAQNDPVVTISKRFPFCPSFPPRQRVREALFQNLRLLYGIGSHYARSLREKGYTSIPDLTSHPRFGKRAEELIAEWGEALDPAAVYRTLSDWLPPSHHLFLQSLALLDSEGILFFDLETLGLANAPIFLIATGRIEEGSPTTEGGSTGTCCGNDRFTMAYPSRRSRSTSISSPTPGGDTGRYSPTSG